MAPFLLSWVPSCSPKLLDGLYVSPTLAVRNHISWFYNVFEPQICPSIHNCG